MKTNPEHFADFEFFTSEMAEPGPVLNLPGRHVVVLEPVTQTHRNKCTYTIRRVTTSWILIESDTVYRFMMTYDALFMTGCMRNQARVDGFNFAQQLCLCSSLDLTPLGVELLTDLRINRIDLAVLYISVPSCGVPCAFIDSLFCKRTAKVNCAESMSSKPGEMKWSENSVLACACSIKPYFRASKHFQEEHAAVCRRAMGHSKIQFILLERGGKRRTLAKEVIMPGSGNRDGIESSPSTAEVEIFKTNPRLHMPLHLFCHLARPELHTTSNIK